MGNLSKRVLGLLAGVCLSACVVDPVPYDRPVPQSDQEIEFVKTSLATAQTRSFETGREFCGYIGLNAEGDLTSTSLKRGRKSSCKPNNVPDDFTEIASYHSHGSYSKNHDSEFPSVNDIEADIFEGNDGYISTPGGRIWFIDGYRMTARLLCGEGCVKSDPRYIADIKLDVGRSYTLEEIERLHDASDSRVSE